MNTSRLSLKSHICNLIWMRIPILSFCPSSQAPFLEAKKRDCVFRIHCAYYFRTCSYSLSRSSARVRRHFLHLPVSQLPVYPPARKFTNLKHTQTRNFLVVHWPRLLAPKAGGWGSIPGKRTKSHIPKLSFHTETKT